MAGMFRHSIDHGGMAIGSVNFTFDLLTSKWIFWSFITRATVPANLRLLVRFPSRLGSRQRTDDEHNATYSQWFPGVSLWNSPKWETRLFPTRIDVNCEQSPLVTANHGVHDTSTRPRIPVDRLDDGQCVRFHANVPRDVVKCVNEHGRVVVDVMHLNRD